MYKNIIVDAVMHLGDLVQATSVIPLLKNLYPNAKISFLVNEPLADLFKIVDGVEHVIPYSYKSGGDYLDVFKKSNQLKQFKFDLSISLDPRTRLSSMMWLAGIPRRVGSPSVFGWKPGVERIFFTDFVQFKDYDISKHSAAENFQQLIKLFANRKDYKLFYPEFDVGGVEKDIKSFWQSKSKTDKAIVIAISVNTVSEFRRWPQEKFVELIDRINEKYSAKIVFVGVKGDATVAKTITEQLKNKHEVIDLCGKTNLVDLAAVFEKVDFLINFDNGIGHYAAAAGCPTITLFSNVDPQKYKPLHKQTLIVGGDYHCVAECCADKRAVCSKECLNAISVDLVMARVDEMIKDRK